MSSSGRAPYSGTANSELHVAIARLVLAREGQVTENPEALHEVCRAATLAVESLVGPGDTFKPDLLDESICISLVALAHALSGSHVFHDGTPPVPAAVAALRNLTAKCLALLGPLPESRKPAASVSAKYHISNLLLILGASLAVDLYSRSESAERNPCLGRRRWGSGTERALRHAKDYHLSHDSAEEKTVLLPIAQGRVSSPSPSDGDAAAGSRVSRAFETKSAAGAGEKPGIAAVGRYAGGGGGSSRDEEAASGGEGGRRLGDVDWSRYAADSASAVLICRRLSMQSDGSNSSISVNLLSSVGAIAMERLREAVECMDVSALTEDVVHLVLDACQAVALRSVPSGSEFNRTEEIGACMVLEASYRINAIRIMTSIGCIHDGFAQAMRRYRGRLVTACMGRVCFASSAAALASIAPGSDGPEPYGSESRAASAGESKPSGSQPPPGEASIAELLLCRVAVRTVCNPAIGTPKFEAAGEMQREHATSVPVAVIPRPLPAIHESSQFGRTSSEYSPMRDKRRRGGDTAASPSTRGTSRMFQTQEGADDVASAAASSSGARTPGFPAAPATGLPDHRFDVMFTGDLRLNSEALQHIDSIGASSTPGHTFTEDSEAESDLQSLLLRQAAMDAVRVPGPDAWLAACASAIQDGLNARTNESGSGREYVAVAYALLLGCASLLDQASMQLVRWSNVATAIPSDGNVIKIDETALLGDVSAVRLGILALRRGAEIFSCRTQLVFSDCLVPAVLAVAQHRAALAVSLLQGGTSRFFRESSGSGRTIATSVTGPQSMPASMLEGMPGPLPESFAQGAASTLSHAGSPMRGQARHQAYESMGSMAASRPSMVWRRQLLYFREYPLASATRRRKNGSCFATGRILSLVESAYIARVNEQDAYGNGTSIGAKYRPSMPAVVPCPADWSLFSATLCADSSTSLQLRKAISSLRYVVLLLPEAAGRIQDEHFASMVGLRAKSHVEAAALGQSDARIYRGASPLRTSASPATASARMEAAIRRAMMVQTRTLLDATLLFLDDDFALDAVVRSLHREMLIEPELVAAALRPCDAVQALTTVIGRYREFANYVRNYDLDCMLKSTPRSAMRDAGCVRANFRSVSRCPARPLDSYLHRLQCCLEYPFLDTSYADRVGAVQFMEVTLAASNSLVRGLSMQPSVESMPHATTDSWMALPVYAAYPHTWSVLREIGTARGDTELLDPTKRPTSRGGVVGSVGSAAAAPLGPLEAVYPPGVPSRIGLPRAAVSLPGHRQVGAGVDISETPKPGMMRGDSGASMGSKGSPRSGFADEIDTAGSARGVFIDGSLAIVKRDLLWPALSGCLLLLVRWLGRKGMGGELDRSIALEYQHHRYLAQQLSDEQLQGAPRTPGGGRGPSPVLLDVARKIMWSHMYRAFSTPPGLARTGMIGYFVVRDSRLSRMLIELAMHDEFGDASLSLLHRLQATALRTYSKSFSRKLAGLDSLQLTRMPLIEPISYLHRASLRRPRTRSRAGSNASTMVGEGSFDSPYPGQSRFWADGKRSRSNGSRTASFGDRLDALAMHATVEENTKEATTGAVATRVVGHTSVGIGGQGSVHASPQRAQASLGGLLSAGGTSISPIHRRSSPRGKHLPPTGSKTGYLWQSPCKLRFVAATPLCLAAYAARRAMEPPSSDTVALPGSWSHGQVLKYLGELPTWLDEVRVCHRYLHPSLIARLQALLRDESPARHFLLESVYMCEKYLQMCQKETAAAAELGRDAASRRVVASTSSEPVGGQPRIGGQSIASSSSVPSQARIDDRGKLCSARVQATRTSRAFVRILRSLARLQDDGAEGYRVVGAASAITRSGTSGRVRGSPAIERLVIVQKAVRQDLADESSGSSNASTSSSDSDISAVRSLSNYVADTCACPAIVHAPESPSRRAMYSYLRADMHREDSLAERNFNSYSDCLGHSYSPHLEGSLLAALHSESAANGSFSEASMAATMCYPQDVLLLGLFGVTRTTTGQNIVIAAATETGFTRSGPEPKRRRGGDDSPPRQSQVPTHYFERRGGRDAPLWRLKPATTTFAPLCWSGWRDSEVNRKLGALSTSIVEHSNAMSAVLEESYKYRLAAVLDANTPGTSESDLLESLEPFGAIGSLRSAMPTPAYVQRDLVLLAIKQNWLSYYFTQDLKGGDSGDSRATSRFRGLAGCLELTKLAARQEAACLSDATGIAIEPRIGLGHAILLVQAASGGNFLDGRVVPSWWDAVDAAGHGLLPQKSHRLHVPLPYLGALASASRLMHVVHAASLSNPVVKAWLLLAVANAVSGQYQFRNRVRLSAAVPHPLDAIARLMHSSDVGIQRACMYELSMLSSLSLSGRQLKFMLSMLRRDPGDMPERAWGIVGTLRRMVMVSRNETRVPSPNLLPSMYTVKTSSGAITSIRRTDGFGEEHMNRHEIARSALPQHGMHLAPRSYFVFGRPGAGLRAVSAVKFHLSARSRIVLERTVVDRERLEAGRLSSGGVRRTDDGGRFYSTHSPSSAAFYVEDSEETRRNFGIPSTDRQRRPLEDRRRVQGPDFAGRQATYGLPYWPVREGYTLSMWVCIFPGSAPTGSPTSASGSTGQNLESGTRSGGVAELARVLEMRMPSKYTRARRVQGHGTGRLGTEPGSVSQPSTGAGADQDEGRSRSNTIGDSQFRAPELVFSARDMPYLARLWDGYGRGLNLSAESSRAGPRSGLCLRLAAVHHSRSRETQEIVTPYPVILPGRWHHVVVVQQPSSMFGTDGMTSLFVDGTLAIEAKMRLPNFQPQVLHRSTVVLGGQTGQESVGSLGIYPGDGLEGGPPLPQAGVYVLFGGGINTNLRLASPSTEVAERLLADRASVDLFGRLGPVVLLKRCLDQRYVLGLFALGPEYASMLLPPETDVRGPNRPLIPPIVFPVETGEDEIELMQQESQHYAGRVGPGVGRRSFGRGSFGQEESGKYDQAVDIMTGLGGDASAGIKLYNAASAELYYQQLSLLGEMTAASLALLRGGFTEDIMFVFSPSVHEKPLFLNTSSSSVAAFEKSAGTSMGEVYAGAQPSALGLLRASEEDMARPPSLLGVHLMSMSGAYSVSWYPARDVVQSSGGVEVIVPLLGQLSIHFESIRYRELQRGASREEALALARYYTCGVGTGLPASLRQVNAGTGVTRLGRPGDIAPSSCIMAGPGLVSFGDGVSGVTHLDPVADTIRLLQGFLSHPGSGADRNRLAYFGGTNLLSHLIRSTSSALLSPDAVKSMWDLSMGVIGLYGSHLTTASHSERVWWRVLRASMLRNVLLDATIWCRSRPDTALEAVYQISHFLKYGRSNSVSFLDAGAVKHCMDAVRIVSHKIAVLRKKLADSNGAYQVEGSNGHGSVAERAQSSSPEAHLEKSADTSDLKAGGFTDGFTGLRPLPRVSSAVSGVSAASSGGISFTRSTGAMYDSEAASDIGDRGNHERVHRTGSTRDFSEQESLNEWLRTRVLLLDVLKVTLYNSIWTKKVRGEKQAGDSAVLAAFVALLLPLFGLRLSSISADAPPSRMLAKLDTAAASLSILGSLWRDTKVDYQQTRIFRVVTLLRVLQSAISHAIQVAAKSRADLDVATPACPPSLSPSFIEAVALHLYQASGAGQLHYHENHSSESIRTAGVVHSSMASLAASISHQAGTRASIHRAGQHGESAPIDHGGVETLSQVREMHSTRSFRGVRNVSGAVGSGKYPAQASGLNPRSGHRRAASAADAGGAAAAFLQMNSQPTGMFSDASTAAAGAQLSLPEIGSDPADERLASRDLTPAGSMVLDSVDDRSISGIVYDEPISSEISGVPGASIDAQTAGSIPTVEATAVRNERVDHGTSQSQADMNAYIHLHGASRQQRISSINALLPRAATSVVPPHHSDSRYAASEYSQIPLKWSEAYRSLLHARIGNSGPYVGSQGSVGGMNTSDVPERQDSTSRSSSFAVPARPAEAIAAVSSELSLVVAQKGSFGIADLLLGLAATARATKSKWTHELLTTSSVLLIDMVAWYSHQATAEEVAARSPGRAGAETHLFAVRSTRMAPKSRCMQELKQRLEHVYAAEPPAATVYASLGKEDIVTELPKHLSVATRSSIAASGGGRASYTHHGPTAVSRRLDPMRATAARRQSGDSIGSAGAMAVLVGSSSVAGTEPSDAGLWGSSRSGATGMRFGIERRRTVSDAKVSQRVAADVMGRLSGRRGIGGSGSVAGRFGRRVSIDAEIGFATPPRGLDESGSPTRRISLDSTPNDPPRSGSFRRALRSTSVEDSDSDSGSAMRHRSASDTSRIPNDTRFDSSDMRARELHAMSFVASGSATTAFPISALARASNFIESLQQRPGSKINDESSLIDCLDPALALVPPAPFSKGVKFRASDPVQVPSWAGEVGLWQLGMGRLDKYALGMCAYDTHEIGTWAAAAVEQLACSRFASTSVDGAVVTSGVIEGGHSLLYLFDVAVGIKASSSSSMLHLSGPPKGIPRQKFDSRIRSRQAWVEAASEGEAIYLCPSACLACVRLCSRAPATAAAPILRLLAVAICSLGPEGLAPLRSSEWVQSLSFGAVNILVRCICGNTSEGVGDVGPELPYCLDSIATIVARCLAASGSLVAELLQIERCIALCIENHAHRVGRSDTVDAGGVLAAIDELGKRRRSDTVSQPLASQEAGEATTASMLGTGGRRRRRIGIAVSTLESFRAMVSCFHAAIVWDLAEIVVADAKVREDVDVTLYVRPVNILVLWITERLGNSSLAIRKRAHGISCVTAATVRRIAKVLHGLSNLMKWMEDHTKRYDFAYPLGACVYDDTDMEKGGSRVSTAVQEVSSRFAPSSVAVLPAVALLCSANRSIYCGLGAASAAIYYLKSLTDAYAYAAVRGTVLSVSFELGEVVKKLCQMKALKESLPKGEVAAESAIAQLITAAAMAAKLSYYWALLAATQPLQEQAWPSYKEKTASKSGLEKGTVSRKLADLAHHCRYLHHKLVEHGASIPLAESEELDTRPGARECLARLPSGILESVGNEIASLSDGASGASSVSQVLSAAAADACGFMEVSTGGVIPVGEDQAGDYSRSSLSLVLQLLESVAGHVVDGMGTHEEKGEGQTLPIEQPVGTAVSTELLCRRSLQTNAACDSSGVSFVFRYVHVYEASLWTSSLLIHLCYGFYDSSAKEDHKSSAQKRQAGSGMLRKLLRVVARERGPWGHGIQRDPDRGSTGVSGFASKSWQVDPRADPTMRRWRSCLLERGDPDYTKAREYSYKAGDYSSAFEASKLSSTGGAGSGMNLQNVGDRFRESGAYHTLQRIEANARELREYQGRRGSEPPSKRAATSGSRAATRSAGDEAEAREVAEGDEDDNGLGLAKEMLEAQHYGFTKRDGREARYSSVNPSVAASGGGGRTGGGVAMTPRGLGRDEISKSAGPSAPLPYSHLPVPEAFDAREYARVQGRYGVASYEGRGSGAGGGGNQPTVLFCGRTYLVQPLRVTRGVVRLSAAAIEWWPTDVESSTHDVISDIELRGRLAKKEPKPKKTRHRRSRSAAYEAAQRHSEQQEQEKRNYRDSLLYVPEPVRLPLSVLGAVEVRTFLLEDRAVELFVAASAGSAAAARGEEAEPADSGPYSIEEQQEDQQGAGASGRRREASGAPGRTPITRYVSGSGGEELFDAGGPILSARGLASPSKSVQQVDVPPAFCGGSFLFAFSSTAARDIFVAFVLGLKPPFVRHVIANQSDRYAALNFLQEAWRQKRLSNFDYLMWLNRISGRTLQDLAYYPVMPWVLSNYSSDELDLNDPSNFRDLGTPIGAITEKRQELAREGIETTRQNYEMAVDMALETGDDPETRPDIVQGGSGHNYGTHYLNAGFVIGYLFRIEPFLRLHVVLHDGKFDKPDRMFNSVSHSWRSASHGQPQEQRELVPEFYYDHSFLLHRSGIDFGQREHTGTPVGDVELPPWAQGSAARFVRVMREALESDHVSANLHKWIDLIFGAHQKPSYMNGASTESKAEDLLNVYHALFYEGSINLRKLLQSEEGRQAVVMARIYRYELGYTPRQLFHACHPQRWLGAPVTLPSIPMLSRGVFGAATPTCSVVAGSSTSGASFHLHGKSHSSRPDPSGESLDASGADGGILDAVPARRRHLRRQGVRAVMPWVPYDRPEFGFAGCMAAARRIVVQHMRRTARDLRSRETGHSAVKHFQQRTFGGAGDAVDMHESEAGNASGGSSGAEGETSREVPSEAQYADLALRLGIQIHYQRILGLYFVDGEQPRLVTVDGNRAVGMHRWTVTDDGAIRYYQYRRHSRGSGGRRDGMTADGSRVGSRRGYASGRRGSGSGRSEKDADSDSYVTVRHLQRLMLDSDLREAASALYLARSVRQYAGRPPTRPLVPFKAFLAAPRPSHLSPDHPSINTRGAIRLLQNFGASFGRLPFGSRSHIDVKAAPSSDGGGVVGAFMSVLGMSGSVQVRGTAEEVSMATKSGGTADSAIAGSHEETRQHYLVRAAYAAGGRTTMGVGSVLGVPFVARTKALECLGRTRRRGLEGQTTGTPGTDLWALVQRKVRGWARNDAASLFDVSKHVQTTTDGTGVSVGRVAGASPGALHELRQARIAHGMHDAARLPLLSGAEATSLADTMSGTGGSQAAAAWTRPWMMGCSTDGDFLLSCMHWDHSFRVSAVAEGMPSVCVVTGHDGPVTCLHVCPRPNPTAEVGAVAAIVKAPSVAAARSIVTGMRGAASSGCVRACSDVDAAAVNGSGIFSGGALYPSYLAVYAAATAALATGVQSDADAGDPSVEGVSGQRGVMHPGESDGDELHRAMEELLDPEDYWSMPSVRPELLQRTAERLDMATAYFRSAPQLPVVTPVEGDGWSGEDVVLTGSSDGTVRVWRLWKGRVSPQPRLTLTGHEDAITCVHASAHFDVVASCSADGSVLLHSLSAGRLIRSIVPAWIELRTSPEPATAIASTAPGSSRTSGSDKAAPRPAEPPGNAASGAGTSEPPTEPPSDSAPARDQASSSDDSASEQQLDALHWCSVSPAGVVAAYSDENHRLYAFKLDGAAAGASPSLLIRGNRGSLSILAACWSYDGATLAIAVEEERPVIRLIDIGAMRQVTTLGPLGGVIPNQDIDGTVDLETARAIGRTAGRKPIGFPEAVTALAFTPGEQYLQVGTANGRLYFLGTDLATKVDRVVDGVEQLLGFEA